jgi:anti-sigma regulatory factor (Ser/Thr protein kinase)
VTEAFQRTFLPEVLPFLPGFRIATRYLPAASAVGVGGDWFDTFPLPSGETVLVIGDVAGHGLPAASLMGKMRNALRAHALLGGSPVDIVQRADTFHRHFGEGELVTLLVGLLAADLATLRFVSAGHLPPLIVDEEGARFATNGHHNQALGVGHGSGFVEETIAMRPGTSVVLYTDGLVERRDESLDAGLERLRSIAERVVTGRPPGPAISELLGEVLGDRRPIDDIAMLIATRDPVPAVQLEFAVEARARSLITIRRAVSRWLADLGIPKVAAGDVVTAVSEASANAVEHAYGPAGGSITVTARLESDVVHVDVRDTGTWRGVTRGDRGQGVRLMRGLMDHVDIAVSNTGTIIRMRRGTEA